MIDSVWDLQAETINGEKVMLRDYVKDKKCIMIVNVASKWGFSDRQYRALV